MTILSKRLQCALEYTKGFTLLADVGTDHAYLPIEAVRLGYVKKAIASDNKEKPLENANSNIQKSGLSDKIEVICADGLSHITPQVDIVSILGMGGNLIQEILIKSNLTHVQRIVLGPNSDAFILRSFLEANHFKIDEETFLVDSKKYYQIIVASKGEMILSDLEKEFGPIIIQTKNDAFISYISSFIHKLEGALQKASQDIAKVTLKERLHLLKELIKWMELKSLNI